MIEIIQKKSNNNKVHLLLSLVAIEQSTGRGKQRGDYRILRKLAFENAWLGGDSSHSMFHLIISACFFQALGQVVARLTLTDRSQLLNN